MRVLSVMGNAGVAHPSAPRALHAQAPGPVPMCLRPVKKNVLEASVKNAAAHLASCVNVFGRDGAARGMRDDSHAEGTQVRAMSRGGGEVGYRRAYTNCVALLDRTAAERHPPGNDSKQGPTHTQPVFAFPH